MTLLRKWATAFLPKKIPLGRWQIKSSKNQLTADVHDPGYIKVVTHVHTYKNTQPTHTA